jgi:YegS C-terminal NAD kinase beta sandwich-like domain
MMQKRPSHPQSEGRIAGCRSSSKACFRARRSFISQHRATPRSRRRITIRRSQSLRLDRCRWRRWHGRERGLKFGLIHFLTRNPKSNLTLSALMLTVSNGPYFGMNYAVAPEQRMDDGLLTVSVFSRYSKVQLWWHFASIAFGRREYSPKWIAFRVAKLRVDGPRTLPVHLDGSLQKDLWPFECKKGALRVFRKTLQ